MTQIATEDGFRLSGSFIGSNRGIGAGVLLLQPCGDAYTQADYAPLAAALSRNGLFVLTFDPRGVGESRAEGDPRAEQGLLWESDTNRAFDQMALHPMESTVAAIVGASCSGAIATSMAAVRDEVRAVVLLSGAINAPEVLGAFGQREIAVLGVGSEDDVLRYRDQGSGEWIETDASSWVGEAVAASRHQGSTHRSFASAGHALAILHTEPELVDEIAAWVATVVDDRR